MQPDLFAVSLEEAIAEVRRGRRICPQEPEWRQLYEMLPGKRQVGRGWEPPLPYTGRVWSLTGDGMKRLCLREQLEWAHKQGCLDQVFAFLKSLPEDRWHHTH